MRIEKEKLGEAIRKRREILGLIQSQLSAISGINTRTIQLVEAGKANPSIETLLQIIDPLGLTLELILKTPANKTDE